MNESLEILNNVEREFEVSRKINIKDFFDLMIIKLDESEKFCWARNISIDFPSDKCQT